jgi:protocatechuate 3,4-dioxygenase beta subunit
MERKEFIKRLGFGSLAFPLLAVHGNVLEDQIDSGISAASEPCTPTPRSTSGPFPTKSPASVIMPDIRSDRTGVEMDIKITVQNKNNNCAPVPGAFVDIWHCDKDGYYSEYGGTGMQSVNYQSLHFLRGRQTTDAGGVASFKSIFPGWYRGRAPHIHVHIYDSTGKSLLVTQIAFQPDVCNTVYTKATQFYTKGAQDTPNDSDIVFSNSWKNLLGTLTGNISGGFVLTDHIVVSA